MIQPKFNVQKISFIGHEALFYLKSEVDLWFSQNIPALQDRAQFDANREVYIEEYRKCQRECKRLREEISALHAARTPSLETRPSVDSMIIEENN
jgi:hypothetical protein